MTLERLKWIFPAFYACCDDGVYMYSAVRELGTIV